MVDWMAGGVEGKEKWMIVFAFGEGRGGESVPPANVEDKEAE